MDAEHTKVDSLANFERWLRSVPLLDNHCHLLSDDLSEAFFIQHFTEGETEERAVNAKTTLAWRRNVRLVASMYGCLPSLDNVLPLRRKMGFQAIVSQVFDVSNIKGILIDDGFRLPSLLPLSWHQQSLPCRMVRRVLRLEVEGERVIDEALRAMHTKIKQKLGRTAAAQGDVESETVATLVDDEIRHFSLEAFHSSFQSAIDPLPPDVVAFKSIAAYRSGLDIAFPSVKKAQEDLHRLLRNELRRNFECTVERSSSEPTNADGHSGTCSEVADLTTPSHGQLRYKTRLSTKSLVDFVVCVGLQVAEKQGIPVQLHTGYGDTDANLLLANPLLLRKVLSGGHRSGSALSLKDCLKDTSGAAGGSKRQKRQRTGVERGVLDPSTSGVAQPAARSAVELRKETSEGTMQGGSEAGADNEFVLEASSAKHSDRELQQSDSDSGHATSREPLRAALVLLHTSYPYCREAGALASLYPNVYLDIGEITPYASMAGQIDSLRAMLDLAPVSKVLYSSDANCLPELFFLGAHCGRAAVARVLWDAVELGDLTPREAQEAAEKILHKNAERLYRL